MTFIEIWLGLAVLLGVAGLVASSWVRWTPKSTARLASYAASFGLIGIGLGDLGDGDWRGAALRTIVAAVELYILGMALQQRDRRAR